MLVNTYLFLVVSVCVQSIALSATATDDLTCEETLDVVIVGAGAAGANSAYQLRHHGKNIALFEVSDRVGGRLYSARLPEAPDLALELGGMAFLPNGHRRFEQLVKELDLPVEPVVEAESKTWKGYYLRGQSISHDDLEKGNVPFDLTKEERENAYRLQWYYIEQLLGRSEPMGGFTRDELMQLRDRNGKLIYELTFAEAIDQVASDDGKELLRGLNVLNVDMLPMDSAFRFLDYYFGDEFRPNQTMMRPSDSMSALPRGLVKSFLEASERHSLRLFKKLVSISDQDEEGLYRLTFLSTEYWNGQLLEKIPEVKHSVCAKQVILALPLNGLRDLDWAPLRSERMRWALEARYPIPAGKFFMTFDHPWWLTLTNSTGLKLSSDLPFNTMIDWRRSKETGVHALLVGYSDAGDALYLQELNEEGPAVAGSTCGNHRASLTAKEELLENLAQALEIPRDAVPEPLSVFSHFWNTYPYEGSWVSSKAGYDMNSIVNITRRPDENGQVFVVGSDHSWGARAYWTEGALETSQDVIDMYFEDGDKN